MTDTPKPTDEEIRDAAQANAQLEDQGDIAADDAGATAAAHRIEEALNKRAPD